MSSHNPSRLRPFAYTIGADVPLAIILTFIRLQPAPTTTAVAAAVFPTPCLLLLLVPCRTSNEVIGAFRLILGRLRFCLISGHDTIDVGTVSQYDIN
ncbi:hypothetical protein BGW80DRAFT_1401725 [Lactifluus volemus]|nr:hypothetical protein BGW80DRAFT_1401725 [Lactifluus volemus]